MTMVSNVSVCFEGFQASVFCFSAAETAGVTRHLRLLKQQKPFYCRAATRPDHLTGVETARMKSWRASVQRVNVCVQHIVRLRFSDVLLHHLVKFSHVVMLPSTAEREQVLSSCANPWCLEVTVVSCDSPATAQPHTVQ